MRTFTSTLLAALAISMVGLSSTPAQAGGCGGGYKYRSYYNYAPIYRHPPVRKIIVEKPVVVEKQVIVEKPVYIQKPVAVAQPVAVQTACFNPHHCHCFVQPGDTWITIAKRQYGNPNLWPFLAQFNKVAPTQQLHLGQQIQLPRINHNGTMLQSTAPAPTGLPMQAGQAPLQQLNQLPAGQPGQPAGLGQPSGLGQPAGQGPLAQMPRS